MKKLIVNKKVFEALQSATNSFSMEGLLGLHANIKCNPNKEWEGKKWSYLNSLSIPEMATALYVGYELELSPEEKALDYYKYLQSGHQHIIRMFLQIAEIDFEGLDDEDLPEF